MGVIVLSGGITEMSAVHGETADTRQLGGVHWYSKQTCNLQRVHEVTHTHTHTETHRHRYIQTHRNTDIYIYKVLTTHRKGGEGIIEGW